MEKFDFEKSINELEGIVKALEKGGMTLEESMKLYTKGTKLGLKCNKFLEGAELKIKELEADE